MFTTIASHLSGEPGLVENLKGKQILGACADLILGVALAVIGGFATQYGFLPIEQQYALIGAGISYFVGSGAAIWLTIKTNRDVYSLRMRMSTIHIT